MNKINAVAAPTYHEVVDWLEGKGITIETSKHFREKTKQWLWYSNVVADDDDFFENSRWSDWCDTREEAINAAILKALELI